MIVGPKYLKNKLQSFNKKQNFKLSNSKLIPIPLTECFPWKKLWTVWKKTLMNYVALSKNCQDNWNSFKNLFGSKVSHNHVSCLFTFGKKVQIFWKNIISYSGTESLPNGCDISLADVSTNENEVKRRSLILSSSSTSGASGQTTQVMNMLKKPFGAANLMTNKLKSASSKHDLIGKEISVFPWNQFHEKISWN